MRDLTLDDYKSSGSLGFVRVASDLGLSEDEKTLVQLLRERHIKDFLRCAVGARVSIIVSGGTTSGKTTLLNALLKEIRLTSVSLRSRTRRSFARRTRTP